MLLALLVDNNISLQFPIMAQMEAIFRKSLICAQSTYLFLNLKSTDYILLNTPRGAANYEDEIT